MKFPTFVADMSIFCYHTDINKKEDNWFLHWECFDPHEPFFVVNDKYKEYYDDDYKGIQFDWPDYQ